MKLRKNMLCGVVLTLAFAQTCWSEIHVTYVKPEQMLDVPATQRGQILNELTGHFMSLDKYLAPDQTLNIEVTSLELSGIVKHKFRTDQDVRVLRGAADWPTMHLLYRLESKGQVIRSGEDDLRNMMYLERMNKYPTSDSLRYEKQMIDDWFGNWRSTTQK